MIRREEQSLLVSEPLEKGFADRLGSVPFK